MKVQLISPGPDEGFAFNEGIYWPMGLVVVGSSLRRNCRDVEVEILDESLIGREGVIQRMGADVVGIQSNSCLTYGGALEVARAAKKMGAITVLGGQFASAVPEVIMARRRYVDFVVEGPGALPMVRIVQDRGGDSRAGDPIPGVWFRRRGAVERPRQSLEFDYEQHRPLVYGLVPVEEYHSNFRRWTEGQFDGGFQIFTHFGCRYRDARQQGGAGWCSYCALGGGLSVRTPEDICNEIREALIDTGVRKGAKVLLKCYGDNASALGHHLERVGEQLRRDPLLQEYDLWWSLYAQSAFVTPRLVEVFRRLRVWEVYIGFDSADDEIQRLNGLGTTRAGHLRAARLLRDAEIRIQAGFVLGCRGESERTLGASLQFALDLRELGNVDVFHASPLVVLPGSPAFHMLSRKMPELEDADFLDTVYLQRLWLKEFCPDLRPSDDALVRLCEVAEEISGLGDVHSSFGGWREQIRS